MLMAIFIRFENGLGPTSTTELLSTIGGPPRAKRKILDELTQAAIIIATDEASGSIVLFFIIYYLVGKLK